MPYRMSGGVPREQFTGADQLLLSICLFIYPDAQSDEIAAFIHTSGGDIYTRQQITDQSIELKLTRKRSSKESYDAFSPASIKSLIWYKTLTPPLGAHDVPIHSQLNMDKTGIYLKKFSRNYSRGHKSCRVRCPAHYRRNEAKLNLILCVESGNPNIPAHMDGSMERPRKWFRLTTDLRWIR